MNIIDFIPFGKENAISRKRLCTLYGTPDRVMRKQIENERGEHAILNAQDGGGYFRPLPKEKPLVERWLRQERSRGRSVEQSTRGAEKFLVGDCGEQGIVAVRSYVRRKRKDESGVLQIEGQMLI
jgi:hypothetical protein